MSEIYSKMIELVGEYNDVYTKQWLKTKLKIKYGEHIMFTEASGKPNVVFFLMLSWDIEIEHWTKMALKK